MYEYVIACLNNLYKHIPNNITVSYLHEGTTAGGQKWVSLNTHFAKAMLSWLQHRHINIHTIKVHSERISLVVSQHVSWLTTSYTLMYCEKMSYSSSRPKIHVLICIEQSEGLIYRNSFAPIVILLCCGIFERVDTSIIRVSIKACSVLCVDALVMKYTRELWLSSNEGRIPSHLWSHAWLTGCFV